MSTSNLRVCNEKPFFGKSKKVLISKDKKLGEIIKSYQRFSFSKSDPYYTLARSIVGQQISVKAAQQFGIDTKKK